MTNGAILYPLKLIKVITYVDKEIFQFMLFLYTLLFCRDVLLQVLQLCWQLQVLCTCPQYKYKLLLLIVIIFLCVLSLVYFTESILLNLQVFIIFDLLRMKSWCMSSGLRLVCLIYPSTGLALNKWVELPILEIINKKKQLGSIVKYLVLFAIF